MLVKEKMKTNNYLVTVTDKSILELKVKGINFLFPITGLSVGFLETYSLEDINVLNSFLYINRILDKEAISLLEELLKKDLSFIRGICFTDLGVLEVVKRMNLSLELIYMQNHNTTNASSINCYLRYVDSVFVSTDITKEEMITILDKSSKPLVVPYFMLVDAMYSRRGLVHNYQKHFGLEESNVLEVTDSISKNSFVAVENENGSVFYQKKFIDYRSIKHANIKYYYVHPFGLTKEMVEAILNGKDMSIISDTGFLDKKTYYRLRQGGE